MRPRTTAAESQFLSKASWAILVLLVTLGNYAGELAHFSIVHHVFCAVHNRFEHVESPMDAQSQESVLSLLGASGKPLTEAGSTECDQLFLVKSKSFPIPRPQTIESLQLSMDSPLAHEENPWIDRDVLISAPKSSPPPADLVA